MKRILVLALAALVVSFGAVARTDIFDSVVIDGSFTMSGTSATSFVGATFAVDMSSTVVIDGATSVRGISAGFTSIEGPALRIGPNANFYMNVAVTTTTGATAITHVGSGATTPAVTWTMGSLSLTGNFATDGATVLLDGSTSVRGVSAGFVSLESPANRLGVNATEYMQIATTDSTGATAITHTGSGPAVTWTANSLAFTGNFSTDGATNLLDGSTSVRAVSAGFVSLEGPSLRLGSDATYYMDVAVTTTTGATAITHAGAATPNVTWTMGSLDLTGNFGVDGTTVALDGSTSVRGISAGFTSLESPANRFGVSDTIYMQIATTDTTGVTTITHTGSDPTVTWTADSFAFVGDTTVDGNVSHPDATNGGIVYVGMFAITYAQTASYTVCRVPANADVLNVEVATTTAFTGGSGTTINIGWSGTADGYASALDIRSAGIAAGDEFGNLGDVGGTNRDVLAQITTDDTAGACVVRVYYTTATPGGP